jgi:asparagine synthase (glutamine-hydrolysing)
MCGFAGFIDFNFRSSEIILTRMNDSINHRGPDDSGIFYNRNAFFEIGLGHKRLSIIDLSSAGKQPMSYGNFHIVYNGEIYNFKEIKIELEELGHSFITNTDTEVILHAFIEWGQTCVAKFNGMFAFAILDMISDELTIIRDRAGVKPIYYYWKDGLFLFASELKSFHQHPAFKKEINERALYQYIDFGYIPAPFCIFKYCHKLNPGHILVLNFKTKEIEISKYWDVYDYYRRPKLNISYEEAKEQLEILLISAFEYRMVADVPIGVFLSGGYDSTAVTALIQNRQRLKLKTFTIGFYEGYNEAHFAKNIAEYIGTDHTEYYCSTKEAQDIIPKLPFYYDEPFADSSAIPTILVSKIAKEKVTVALSADAADEIFAGYNYLRQFLVNLEILKKIPLSVRIVISFIAKVLGTLIPVYDFKNKMKIVRDVFKIKPELLPQLLHQNYFQINKNIKKSLFTDQVIIQSEGFDNDFSNFQDDLSKALAADYKMYLQNDILTKVDRATMSVALEGREPFLDHRIIEFVAQLPSEFKYNGTIQKRILKDIVHDYVPKSLMDRPKTGFEVPIYKWLKTDLSYLLDLHLNSDIITSTGFFNPRYVQKLRRDFQADKLKDPSVIWKILQFQMWYKTWMN